MTDCKELETKGGKENKENKEYQNSELSKTALKFKVDQNNSLLIQRDLENQESISSIESISFRKAFGSNNAEMAKYLINSLDHIFGTNGDREANINFAFAFLQEINAKDPLEAMLAIQMLGTHLKSISCLGKANSSNQTDNFESENINRATKLTRTFLAQMEALKKYRDKGEQKVNVENVNINDGGKAVIGSTINTENR